VNTAALLLALSGGAAIPRDLPLPLPVPPDVLRVLIVGVFLLHILFVNLMVGGSLLTLIFEIVGLRHPRFDRLARCIGQTVTVNKSLAVVLGIAPLLAINLLYTTAFYTANALTGHVWILLVPLIAGAFLLTYLHKFTWDRWTGPRKWRHIATAAGASAILLFVPLIFLVNINLMLFPDTWARVTGFLAALRVGNVIPRYFHFLSASLAVTGLFLAYWFRRPRFPLETLPGFTRPWLVRHFYKWAFGVSVAQFGFGPMLLLTLPRQGLSLGIVQLILNGALLAIFAVYLLRREIRSSDAAVGRLFWPIAAIFLVVVVAMGQGRHLYREKSLAPFREQVYWRTAEFRAIEIAAWMTLSTGRSLTDPPDPETLFLQTCGTCHSTTARSAPTFAEVAQLYAGNPAGIVIWAKAPGKKRGAFEKMPSFAHLGDESLTALAAIMLARGSAGK